MPSIIATVADGSINIRSWVTRASHTTPRGCAVYSHTTRKWHDQQRSRQQVGNWRPNYYSARFMKVCDAVERYRCTVDEAIIRGCLGAGFGDFQSIDIQNHICVSHPYRCSAISTITLVPVGTVDELLIPFLFNKIHHASFLIN